MKNKFLLVVCLVSLTAKFFAQEKKFVIIDSISIISKVESNIHEISLQQGKYIINHGFYADFYDTLGTQNSRYFFDDTVSELFLQDSSIITRYLQTFRIYSLLNGHKKQHYVLQPKKINNYSALILRDFSYPSIQKVDSFFILPIRLYIKNSLPVFVQKDYYRQGLFGLFKANGESEKLNLQETIIGQYPSIYRDSIELLPHLHNYQWHLDSKSKKISISLEAIDSILVFDVFSGKVETFGEKGRHIISNLTFIHRDSLNNEPFEVTKKMKSKSHYYGDIFIDTNNAICLREYYVPTESGKHQQYVQVYQHRRLIADDSLIPEGKILGVEGDTFLVVKKVSEGSVRFKIFKYKIL